MATDPISPAGAQKSTSSHQVFGLTQISQAVMNIDYKNVAAYFNDFHFSSYMRYAKLLYHQ